MERERTFTGPLCEPGPGGERLLEADLQYLWFEHGLPRRLVTADGQPAEIVQTGWWCREGGPDFRDAAVRFGGRVLRRGDIEVHLDAVDWERHRHHLDPNYNDLVLHVALRGTRPARLESGVLVPTVELGPQLAEAPAALLAHLPPRLGPAPGARPGACVEALAGMSEGRRRELFEEAGRHRLWLKSARLLRQWRRDSRTQTLWEALAEGFGYKENQVAFRLLARRAPVRSLRGLSRLQREARLFGIAGFLPRVEISSWGEVGRGYAAELWSCWWGVCDRAGFRPMPGHLWRLSRSRPANHPQRRVAALATACEQMKRVEAVLDKGEIDAFAEILRGLRHDFFECHATLRSLPAPARIALVGESRIGDLAINLAVPWVLALGRRCSPRAEDLPPTQQNRAVRTTAERLFGSRAPLFRPASALEQQGLLQIFHGFCGRDASECAECPFPGMAAQWAASGSQGKGFHR